VVQDGDAGGARRERVRRADHRHRLPADPALRHRGQALPPDGDDRAVRARRRLRAVADGRAGADQLLRAAARRRARDVALAARSTALYVPRFAVRDAPALGHADSAPSGCSLAGTSLFTGSAPSSSRSSTRATCWSRRGGCPGIALTESVATACGSSARSDHPRGRARRHPHGRAGARHGPDGPRAVRRLRQLKPRENGGRADEGRDRRRDLRGVERPSPRSRAASRSRSRCAPTSWSRACAPTSACSSTAPTSSALALGDEPRSALRGSRARRRARRAARRASSTCASSPTGTKLARYGLTVEDINLAHRDDQRRAPGRRCSRASAASHDGQARPRLRRRPRAARGRCRCAAHRAGRAARRRGRLEFVTRPCSGQPREAVAPRHVEFNVRGRDLRLVVVEDAQAAAVRRPRAAGRLPRRVRRHLRALPRGPRSPVMLVVPLALALILFLLWTALRLDARRADHLPQRALRDRRRRHRPVAARPPVLDLRRRRLHRAVRGRGAQRPGARVVRQPPRGRGHRPTSRRSARPPSCGCARC
jgi:hypothetical protein